MAIPTQSNDLQKQQDLIRKRFSQVRLGAEGQERRTRRDVKKGLDRFSAVSGAPTGAVQKARSTAQTDVGRQFGEVGAQIGAAEAQTMQVAEEQEAGRKLAREQMSEQARQFDVQLEELKRQFGQKMELEWAGFDQSVTANFLNAGIAMAESGFWSDEDWSRVLSGLGALYPERSKAVKSGQYSLPQDEAMKGIIYGPGAVDRSGG